VKKLASLRAALIASVPAIAADPSALEVYVERGEVRARPGSLSFEYGYTASLWIQAFAGNPTDVYVPLLGWIADHQPDLFEKGDSRPFAFESEMLDADSIDLLISIELTELVRVTRVAAGLKVDYLNEPVMSDRFDGVPPGTNLWRGLLDDLVTGSAGAVPA
jgi:hypothetical protein